LCIEAAIDPISPPTVRLLWKAGIGVALFILTLAVGNAFVSRDRALSSDGVGLDFIAFYTAGTFVREGRAEDLYNLPAVVAYQRELANQSGSDLGGGFGPWWNPPFYALLFVPLSMLSFSASLNTWLAINILCIVAALLLLVRMLPPVNWRTSGLVPLLMLTSMPFLLTLSHGQNTGMSLLILCGMVTLWRSNRAVAAGLVGGLLMYKPQLGAVVAVVLTLALGWRALLGLAVTGSALLVATVLTLPGSIEHFLTQMPANLHTAQVVQTYMWERHVTLKAFFRLLIQGFTPGEMWMATKILTFSVTLLVAAALAVMIWRGRQNRDLLIAATVIAMPLVMPFYFDYDLLLLSVAAVLQVRVAPTRGAVVLWASLFIWLMLAHHIAPLTHVNLTAPILLAIFGSVVLAMKRSEPRAISIPLPVRPPLANAA